MKILLPAKELAAVFGNKLVRLLSGPFTMILIPLYLTPELQGYWYTIGSLGALAVFADLGFTSIVMQFAAHEFAHIVVEPSGNLAGSSKHLSRLKSFQRFAITWALISAIVFSFLMVLGAVLVFYKTGFHLFWIAPFLLFALGSAINFYVAAKLSFYEGSGHFLTVQKIRIIQSVVSSGLVIGLLLLHWGLYASAVSMLCVAVLSFVLVASRFRAFQGELNRIVPTEKPQWTKEVLPLFTRYSLSFASGYFIFSIFTPLSFQSHGPAAAGRVGITMTLISALFQLSNSWLAAINPRMNALVATGDRSTLLRIFLQRLWLSSITFLAGFVFVLLVFLFWTEPLGAKIISRFESLTGVLILGSAWLCQLVVNGLALYMRAHKEEPLVIPSLVAAIWVFLTTLAISQYLPEDWLFLGFLSHYIWGLPVAYWFFVKTKRKHGNSP